MTTSDILCHTLERHTTLAFENSRNHIGTTKNTRYMRIDMRNATSEVPLFCDRSADKYRRTYHVLYIPLKQTTDPEIIYVKTPSTMVNNMSRIRDELIRRVDLKGEKYYMGKGIVFYGDYTPMFSFVSKVQSLNFRLEKVILKVNAAVYRNEDPVSKFVRNQIIPKTTFISNIWVGNTSTNINGVEILITDNVVDMFTPVVPSRHVNPLGIDNFLKENSDLVIKEWEYW